MKISEMINNLQLFLEEHGDLECYYAVDDEGNDYCPVHYEPSLYFMNQYRTMFSSRDLEDEDEEDIEELTRICIIN